MENLKACTASCNILLGLVKIIWINVLIRVKSFATDELAREMSPISLSAHLQLVWLTERFV